MHVNLKISEILVDKCCVSHNWAFNVVDSMMILNGLAADNDKYLYVWIHLANRIWFSDTHPKEHCIKAETFQKSFSLSETLQGSSISRWRDPLRNFVCSEQVKIYHFILF